MSLRDLNVYVKVWKLYEAILLIMKRHGLIQIKIVHKRYIQWKELSILSAVL